jgi:apolipoprotein N-acyltransferase
MAHSLARSAHSREPGVPRRFYVLALVLGACNTLAFTPATGAGWLELLLSVAFAGLLARSTGARSAALLAGGFGFGNFASGIWWVYVSMHDYGAMPAPLAAAAAALLALGMALYAALGGALWWRASRVRGNASASGAAHPLARWRASLMLASAWALANWLRGTVLTGFPWLATGYPQADGPLKGYAAVIGVYGVGWLVIFSGALLAQALQCVRKPAAGRPWAPLALAALLLLGGGALQRAHWTMPSGAPLSVRLLQGNVPQDMKFSERGVDDALALYQRMIVAAPADLIVTPETALPVLIQQVPQQWGQAARAFVDRTGSALIFGAVGATDTGQGYRDLTNSLYGMTPANNVLYRYDKHHLVPFGEFIPWGFRWFVDLMQIPLGDFSHGASVQPPMQVRDQRLAPNVCYEDIFGEEIARTLRGQPEPATILVNASNLGWFGNTNALPQALQMAQMRALETGRPMLSATNTGPTAAVSADGDIAARLAPFTVGALAVQVQGRSGLTPYIRLGNAPVLLLSLALLAAGLWLGRGGMPQRGRQKVAQERHSR